MNDTTRHADTQATDTARQDPLQAPAVPRHAGWIEAVFRLLGRLRRAPVLHPDGLTCAADLEVTAVGDPWDVPWLERPARYRATVRLSRAAGMPRRLPDGLGLAVRVEDADGPGHCLDLLLTSSGRGRMTRHVPLPRSDALAGPYSSLVSYQVGGRSCVLAAFPRRAAHAPVHGDPTTLARALGGGPLVFDLCAETPPPLVAGVRRPHGPHASTRTTGAERGLRRLRARRPELHARPRPGSPPPRRLPRVADGPPVRGTAPLPMAATSTVASKRTASLP